jgi:hypothetical protein
VLSYYNQPDHELIDRRDEDVRKLFDRLTRCEAAASADGGDNPWLAALDDWGAPAPVAETIDGATYALCWPGFLVMAVPGKASPRLLARCADLGRDLIEIPVVPTDAIPPALADKLGMSM